ncbi:hypothetical protein D1610_07915 [Sphingomonas gilva]|uniref:Uncharacterized protein n=1 Tax=Sphingomonas gilva TaxID=2305907 RepID=A0A396S4M2_9SPHN|nr:hypothetical protein [Sphingomonas gilva]RHW18375.1 hypothetical protein D1610_07915 [Sphingomonas gilva]
MAGFAIAADRAFRWISERRDRLRKYGLALALLMFIGGLAWAMSRLPDLPSRLRYEPLLALLVIGAPVGALLNSVELHALSRIGGGRMAWRTAFEVTVYTNAANMLPLPGGALAKMAAMKLHGVGYRAGSAMIVLSYAVWGGLAFLYSAGALMWLGQGRLAALFATLGAALLLICGAGFARFAHWRMVGIVALMRLVSLPLEALRYVLAMMAVGTAIGFGQSSVFVVASFVGSAAMIAPSGLGVGETVVALLSPAVAVPAAVGFVGAAIGRVVWMTGLALTAGLLLLARARRGVRPALGAF